MKLLDAATAIVEELGTQAVTVSAVLERTGIARATFYRHHPSVADLLAATMVRLLPPPPKVPARGSLRNKLRALVRSQSANAPTTLIAMSWLTIHGDPPGMPWSEAYKCDEAANIQLLRQRLAEYYVAPVVQIVESTSLRSEIDLIGAVRSLLGPVVFARLSGLPEADCTAIGNASVDSFLATHLFAREAQL